MPKQRTAGRSTKHVRTAKMLITGFAIAATMAGCSALKARSNAEAIFVPAITVDIDDLAAPSPAASLRLMVNSHMTPDDVTPTQPPARSRTQMR